MTPIEAMDTAKEFVSDNIVDCSKDLLEWKETGLLPYGKMQELGKILRPCHEYTFLSVAEALIVVEALRLVAKVPKLEQLIKAVASSEFEGIRCLDVDGSNWFDRRDDLVGRKR